MSVDWITVVVSAAINTPAVAGLLGWLGKRRSQNEMALHHAELETLKAEYGKQLEEYKSQLEQSKLLVTQVHFETEFEALKAAFAKLAEVKLQMAGLRPQLRVGPAAQSPAVRLATGTVDGTNQCFSESLQRFARNIGAPERVLSSQHLRATGRMPEKSECGNCGPANFWARDLQSRLVRARSNEFRGVSDKLQ